jgi:predicted transcriptional regulator
LGRKSGAPITEAELRIMRILWARGSATVNDIVAGIKKPKLARNTVLTTLGVIERKGFASHIVQGRTFVYRPEVAQEDVRVRALDDVVARFFDSSPSQLVLRLLDSKRMTDVEADSIRALLDARKDER